MISKIIGAIKRIFGGGSDSDFEDAQTDPGVDSAPSAPAAEAPKKEAVTEDAPTEVEEDAPIEPAKKEANDNCEAIAARGMG